jgi:hypothetical protein
MKVFAQDDLNSNLNQPSGQTEISASPDSGFLSSFSFDEALMDVLIKNINLFVLAWSIFFTVFLLSHFFNHRVLYSWAELSTEKLGMKGIFKLLGLWWRYMLCLLMLVVYGFLRDGDFGLFVGILTILVYISKIYIDLGSVLDLLNYKFGWMTGISNWLKATLYRKS